MQRLVITAPTNGQRVLTWALAVTAQVLLLCLGLIILDPLRHLVGVTGVICYALFALLAEGVMIYSLCRVHRSVIWLEGSRLAVRGAFTTRGCDLSTAPVRIGGGNAVVRVPSMLAQHRPGGWLRVPLRTRDGDLLDSRLLHALADAVTVGSRAEPERSQAAWVADGLRQLASNPAYHML